MKMFNFRGALTSGLLPPIEYNLNAFKRNKSQDTTNTGLVDYCGRCLTARLKRITLLVIHFRF